MSSKPKPETRLLGTEREVYERYRFADIEAWLDANTITPEH